MYFSVLVALYCVYVPSDVRSTLFFLFFFYYVFWRIDMYFTAYLGQVLIILLHVFTSTVSSDRKDHGLISFVF